MRERLSFVAVLPDFLALGTRLSALISSIFFRLKVLLFPGV